MKFYIGLFLYIICASACAFTLAVAINKLIILAKTPQPPTVINNCAVDAAKWECSAIDARDNHCIAYEEIEK